MRLPRYKPARKRRSAVPPPPAPKPPADPAPGAVKPRSETLPLLPLQQAVMFPFSMSSLVIDTPRGMKAVETAMAKNRRVALVPVLKKDAEPENTEDYFGTCCVGRIVKVLRFPDDTLRVLIRGLFRARLEEVTPSAALHLAKVRPLPMPEEKNPAVEALARTLANQFGELVTLSPNLPDELKVAMLNLDDAGRLADLVANSINISFEEKLKLLATVGVTERLEAAGFLTHRELQLAKLGQEIQEKVHSAFGKSQREAFLREQLRTIQEQLGEEDTPDTAELRKKLQEAELPPEAKETAERELDRLRKMHPASGDYNVIRTYLDWLLALPWRKETTDKLAIQEARTILDADHFGLDKIKDRILEFLAVLQLNPGSRGPILCFAGPPGVGKTSLGHSIAKAMGREFVRVSLGGIRDEAEIRGHRRTYVGALPGRILQGIRRAKTRNPVFMLDEIDKLGNDFRGDPGAALLETLDPAQNAQFSDHYLEVPFDLSRVLFITTANVTDLIPPALLDRLEVIHLPGYAPAEKQLIASRFLIPRQLANTGLNPAAVSFQPAAVDRIIEAYTWESGVRNLEREIGTVCRKLARRQVETATPPPSVPSVDSVSSVNSIGSVASASVASSSAPTPITVTPELVGELLGPPKLFPETAICEPQVGAAAGLAWTSAGGDLLHIEVSAFPGKGGLQLTGSLGDVMKESAQTAFSFVKSHQDRFGFTPKTLEKLDLHLHVPAGATPKDGPSAGVTIATALASRLSGRPVRARLAMTGEISLRGRLMPVGGIKEKILAAARAGVTTVFLPEKNRADVEEIPAEFRQGLACRFFTNALDAVEAALEPSPKT
ncbi:MAG: endopeptidase La [Lentisphaeria bacterium]